MNTVTGARGVWGVLSETLLARVAMSSTLGLARELVRIKYKCIVQLVT